MSEHEKRVLTPEEVIARKGNAPRDYTATRHDEAEATEVAPSAYHLAAYPGDGQSVPPTLRDTAETPIRAS